MSDPGAEQYSRQLESRHINMIAIGGAIGVGLFMGSGKALHQVGPGLVLVYALAGFVIFLVMRALGELLMHRPVSGSFAEYAGEFVGPLARFATGWGYWVVWIAIPVVFYFYGHRIRKASRLITEVDRFVAA